METFFVKKKLTWLLLESIPKLASSPKFRTKLQALTLDKYHYVWNFLQDKFTNQISFMLVQSYEASFKTSLQTKSASCTSVRKPLTPTCCENGIISYQRQRHRMKPSPPQQVLLRVQQWRVQVKDVPLVSYTEPCMTSKVKMTVSETKVATFWRPSPHDIIGLWIYSAKGSEIS